MATPAPASTSTLSLPSLLLLLVLAFLLLRYYFFTSPSASTASAARESQASAGNERRVDARAVEQVAQMFPQLGRREIAWEMVRNGGSVGATTERVLAGGGLEVPPPSFQPALLHSPSSASSASPGPDVAPSHPNLITRYNLASKLNQDYASSAAEEGEAPAKGKLAWSQNKSERQAVLRRRREEMILGARRRMEEKEREGVRG